MIGGRVLDTTALYAVVARTPYLAAVAAWATALPVALLIPSTVWLRALLDVDDAGRHMLNRFATLEPVVFAELALADVADLVAASRGAGVDLDAVHAVRLGVQRGWEVITARPDVLLGVNPDVRTESLS